MQHSDLGVASLCCPCGRSFTHSSALANHRRACTNGKRKLSEMLSLARENWIENKKRRRLLATAPSTSSFDRESDATAASATSGMSKKNDQHNSQILPTASGDPDSSSITTILEKGLSPAIIERGTPQAEDSPSLPTVAGDPQASALPLASATPIIMRAVGSFLCH
jgi:hypothetical protein